MANDTYPAWHPVVHHSLVVCFLLTMVSLPILYIRTRQPPYWVLLVIFCSFITLYALYWVLACSFYREHHAQEQRRRTSAYTDKSAPSRSATFVTSNSAVDAAPSRSHQVHPMTMSNTVSTTITNTTAAAQQQPSSSSSSPHHSSGSIEIPPTYEIALSHVAVEVPPNSPPSYHSGRQESDEEEQEQDPRHQNATATEHVILSDR